MKPKSETRAAKVLQAAGDGKWHTLAEITAQTGYPEASVICQ
jgi:hypothetical protein